MIGFSRETQAIQRGIKLRSLVWFPCLRLALTLYILCPCQPIEVMSTLDNCCLVAQLSREHWIDPLVHCSSIVGYALDSNPPLWRSIKAIEGYQSLELNDVLAKQLCSL